MGRLLNSLGPRFTWIAAGLWLIVALILLAGCSLLIPRVGPELSKAITRYCAQPLAERRLVRESVNAQIAPNQLRVTCAGDPPDPAPPASTSGVGAHATDPRADRARPGRHVESAAELERRGADAPARAKS